MLDLEHNLNDMSYYGMWYEWMKSLTYSLYSDQWLTMSCKENFGQDSFFVWIFLYCHL